MTFKDFNINISYKNVGEDKFSDILNPLLSCTKYYKRCVGFFSSSALNFIGDGIADLARSGGQILIATSPKLSDEDIVAIQSGYDLREIFQNNFIKEFEEAIYHLSDRNAALKEKTSSSLSSFFQIDSNSAVSSSTLPSGSIQPLNTRTFS